MPLCAVPGRGAVPSPKVFPSPGVREGPGEYPLVKPALEMLPVAGPDSSGMGKLRHGVAVGPQVALMGPRQPCVTVVGAPCVLLLLPQVRGHTTGWAAERQGEDQVKSHPQCRAGEVLCCHHQTPQAGEVCVRVCAWLGLKWALWLGEGKRLSRGIVAWC